MASQILNIPNYCDIFKFILVDELVFSDPLEFHYGKCSVIGKLAFKNDSYYLQNIQLKCIAEEYQLPTGTEEVLLLPNTRFDNFQNGAFAEVHGDAVFWLKDTNWSQRSNKLPKTTKDLMTNLRTKHLVFNDEDSQMILDEKVIPADCCHLDEDAIQKSLEIFSSTWMPAIQVLTMNIINDAEALIDVNLRLRLLMKEHDQINNN